MPLFDGTLRRSRIFNNLFFDLIDFLFLIQLVHAGPVFVQVARLNYKPLWETQRKWRECDFLYFTP